MKKILFENGKTIDGASTFNTMQDNIEEVFNGEEAMGSIVVDDITCKNILETATNPQTSNGITKTYDIATKKIVFSGTATATAYLRVSYDVYLEANKTYTISTNEILPSGASIYANNYANVGLAYADLTIASGSKSKTFTTTKAGTISFSIVVNSGTTVNLSLSVQLEKGLVATDYVEHKEFNNAPKLLWINSSSNTAFSTQDITLSSSDYNMLIWIFDTYVSSGLSESEISLKGFGVRASTINGIATKSMSRNITMNSDTSFTVASAYNNGEVDDNALIPRAVYGLKIS